MARPADPRLAPQRLVVAITGASGAAYGVRMLEACQDLGVESHLVMSRSSVLTPKPTATGRPEALRTRSTAGATDRVWASLTPVTPATET